MAKKKAKKTAKSKPKSKPPKRKINPKLLLLKKISRIRARVPQIEPTGECIDPDTKEVMFRFTEAQYVFEIYLDQCAREKLIFRPYVDEHIQPKAIAVGNMPLLLGTFCIEDLETGARLVGFGSGMGRNLDWSANTAGTRALKQFLLTTFGATWKDPEDTKNAREQLKEEVKNELIADGTMSAIDELKNFYGQQFERKKDDSQGKNPPDSRRPDSKKARTGKKRDNRRGK